MKTSIGGCTREQSKYDNEGEEDGRTELSLSYKIQWSNYSLTNTYPIYAVTTPIALCSPDPRSDDKYLHALICGEDYDFSSPPAASSFIHFRNQGSQAAHSAMVSNIEDYAMTKGSYSDENETQRDIDQIEAYKLSKEEAPSFQFAIKNYSETCAEKEAMCRKAAGESRMFAEASNATETSLEDMKKDCQKILHYGEKARETATFCMTETKKKRTEMDCLCTISCWWKQPTAKICSEQR